jgi:CHASE2 domain-containing sensor protein
MGKLFETLLEMVKDYSKKHFPSFYALIKKVLELRSLIVSWMARQSRRFGVRTIVTVGLIASLYACYLFVQQTLSPGTPKPTHDVILKGRFSSPAPSREIVILDIDERTLASLASQHGRWPWSREVLADGLEKMGELGIKAILFNVMMSDPDKNNPDSDAAMGITAQMVRPLAFPMIRLNPENDKESQLQISRIPGAIVTSEQVGADKTIAAILPMFDAMHDRLGIANQQPDVDGIVRRYPMVWREDGFMLPSIVQRTLQVSGQSTADVPEKISLNWRNKQGRYERISYSDLLQGKLGEDKLEQFKDAYVVLTISAPGLGQTKPTSVRAVEDDGEILATALDDALQGTWLRTLPAVVNLAINLVTIWVLVWISFRQIMSGALNRLFVLVQSALGMVSLVSASYTNYLIDMSDSMSFGLGVFAAIKLVQSLDDRWSRAKPGFRKIVRGNGLRGGNVRVLGYLDDMLTLSQALGLQARLEKIFGLQNVIRIDDLFGGESFVKATCSKFKCLLVHIQEDQQHLFNELLEQDFKNLFISEHELQTDWNPENHDFSNELAALVLKNASLLLETRRRPSDVRV